jgi:restriction system protein
MRRDQVKADLFALFGEQDPHRRGKALEEVLNRLFEVEQILIREAFERRDQDTGRAIEQIDGAIELDGRVYLVEMKWWNQPLGRGEVASHLVRVYGRGDVGGILISNSQYHPSAIADCKDALTRKTIVLVELREIVQALTLGRSVRQLLSKRSTRRRYSRTRSCIRSTTRHGEYLGWHWRESYRARRPAEPGHSAIDPVGPQPSSWARRTVA